MAPSRPAPSLVVRTPRHASRRLRPALAAEIRRVAKERDGADIALDEKSRAHDPSYPLGIASDNASEWNSLLISARADRGPQWDVSTQRFMVDYGSHLYFDSTSLTYPEERTPPPEDAPAPQVHDNTPHLQWQGDPRFTQFGGAAMHSNPSLMSTPTPPRTSLRLQQHQAQSPLNGHALGNGIVSPHQYPYGLPNERPQHFEPGQSFYDGSGQQHTPNMHHGLTNGMNAGAMMTRQGSTGIPIGGNVNLNMGNMGMGMGSVGMGGMDFAIGGHVAETQSMRTRTRSQQEGNLEMGW